jgi:hypothetical protein
MSDAKTGYGLTASGRTRTRPLRTAATAALPPAMSTEEVPGYLYYQPANIWVYAEDFTVVIEVAQELANPSITSRHGTRTSKNRGCDGPLCRKALRDSLYGGARTARLKRIEPLLAHLQEQHDEAWVKSLPKEERDKLEANANRVLETMRRRLEILQV